MEFDNKIDILYEFISDEMHNYENEEYVEFFENYDLSVPYVIGLVNDHLVVNEKGIALIEEAYGALLEIFGGIVDKEYIDLQELREELDN